MRDVGRQIKGQATLAEAFAPPLGRVDQIRSQQRRQRGLRLYSLHVPEVAGIGKGKPYEFGAKASTVTNNRRAPAGLFVRRARPLSDKPYDGRTLAS